MRGPLIPIYGHSARQVAVATEHALFNANADPPRWQGDAQKRNGQALTPFGYRQGGLTPKSGQSAFRNRVPNLQRPIMGAKRPTACANERLVSGKRNSPMNDWHWRDSCPAPFQLEPHRSQLSSGHAVAAGHRARPYRGTATRKQVFWSVAPRIPLSNVGRRHQAQVISSCSGRKR